MFGKITLKKKKKKHYFEKMALVVIRQLYEYIEIFLTTPIIKEGVSN
jgi:hypothetical protein